ncbi:hypothetical protein C5L19_001425 [Lactobacillus delbrueckii subsp. jakobsenii]|nr:hypothetical protein C5L19_001425 [Lactobacillus delbrueckii subsp. jakobsenii]
MIFFILTSSAIAMTCGKLNKQRKQEMATYLELSKLLTEILIRYAH